MPKIDVNDIPDPSQNKPARPDSGQQFVKWIGPAGIVLFLGLLVFFFIFCFSGGDGSIDGYTPPYDSGYYALHLDELKAELEGEMLPLLGRRADISVTGDALTVKISDSDYAYVRRSMLHYYDKALFVFERSSQ